jgi:hypothetical protein
MPMSKVTLEQLKSLVVARKPMLLNKVGFEDRSIASASLKYGVTWPKVFTLASTDRSEKADGNLQKLREEMSRQGTKLELIGELEQNDPLETQNTISKALSVVLDRWTEGELWIDFTALRREELLILVRLLVDRCESSTLAKIFGLYVSATEMGEWLSGDVVDIRSVVGYPGEISPARSTTLIALIGFETNRARAIIEAYEPSRVLLGVPELEGSINKHLFDRNLDVLKRVSEDYGPLVSRNFVFSANDPLKAVNDLESIITDCGDENIVLAPLHTKISTIAAGVVAQKNPKIQVCYAAVDDYNEEAYSKPGDDVYLIPFSFLAQ